jgi:ABC-type Fe3+ transport system substrate-binding protein
VITPHNEAIRHEYGRAFSAWHQEQYGSPVKIDWRAIGGTSEIMRYLEAEYTSAFRAAWRRAGHAWSAEIGRTIVDRRFRPDAPPADLDERARDAWARRSAAYTTFRTTDDATEFSSQIDLFFGGGEYDHNQVFVRGLTVPPWPEGEAPHALFYDETGRARLPEGLSGETWRTPFLFGTALSTFGICYNVDRLEDLGLAEPPRRWVDLAEPAYFRQLGLADPTKSGSISKAFEMIIHQQCYDRIRAEGFSDDDIEAYETAIANGSEEVPAAYHEALEKGWRDGIALVQGLGANARYFTDSASKVPIDVSNGDAAAGLAIDFYGRYQAQVSQSPRGEERMRYITPTGGSSVSADPISLLRGAPNRELAVRFIRFVLSEEGQKLWNYAPGTPGGPEKYALRRLPILADFYPLPNDPASKERFARHAPHLTDDFADPEVNPYVLADQFTYRGRWTGRHFNIHRDLIRAMCLDSAQELQQAWSAIIAHGGPEANPEAMRLMQRLPDVPYALNWQNILVVPREMDRLDYMREWTRFFRESYREAQAAVAAGGAG